MRSIVLEDMGECTGSRTAAEQGSRVVIVRLSTLPGLSSRPVVELSVDPAGVLGRDQAAAGFRGGRALRCPPCAAAPPEPGRLIA